MEITPSAAGQQPGTDKGVAPEKRPALNSDFETFLTMLTAQLQNQDPLNPIDSTDYAVQLATFSSVEQQVKTNQLLGKLADQMGSTGLGRLSGWIGMEARVAAPAAFHGSPLTVYPTVEKGADSAVLVVKDASGTEVSRQPIDPAGGPVDWAGVDSNGQPFADGIYQFLVESRKNGSVSTTSPAETYATVREVRAGTEGSEIVLDSGAIVPADQVRALRMPGAASPG